MSASVLLKPTELRVGGLARLSSCDWPGELAATVFCQGCGWDCAYCHNAHLRPADAAPQISWPEVLTFLESRRGLLDAVVFSGGEPTLQPCLMDAIAEIKKMEFRIGLHTAGMMPERLARLLSLVDWVGFDVKAPFEAYARITGVEESGVQALQSLRMLLASGVAYEVRTTLHPALLSVDEMIALQGQLIDLGVTHYAVQRFRPNGTRPERLRMLPEALDYGLPVGYGDGFQQFSLR